MKKMILPIAAAICTAAVMTACGQKTVTYTTGDFLSIEVSGLNGEGTASVYPNNNFFDERINADIFEGEGTELELAQYELLITDAVNYDFEGSSENLSNGDTVTVKMTADNERLKEYGVAFDCSDLTYTVEGLTEPVELKFFDDTEVTFSGTAPNGSAAVSYTGSDEFVKSNVRFTIDKPFGLSNGDTIRVTASCLQQLLDDNAYFISETEKEFTVEGLAYLAEDLNGFDLSQINEELEAKGREKIEDSSSYQVGEKTYSYKLFADGNLTEMWQVTGVEIKPAARYLFTSPTNNRYVVFSKAEVTAEKTSKKGTSVTDGYEQGDTVTVDIYSSATMSGIYVTADGTLDTSNASVSAEGYGNSIWGEYIGMTLDEIVEEYTKTNANGWNVTEIN